MSTPKVFISYRRDDCQGTADFLYSLLEDHFDSENVFFDVDSIDPGRNYVEYLDEQVSQCTVLLALIGKRWITAENKAGERRLFDEKDFVRKEIISAMDQGITVIPLLVERAEMPAADLLPEELGEFCEHQATEVRPGSDFKKDVAKLIKDLERIEPAKDTHSLDEQIIEGAIRYGLNKFTGQLTNEDLGKVERLSLNDKQISDVSDLAKLTQLTELALNNNKITDVSALKELTQLTELWLGENQLTDVSALAKLTQLTELDISSNQIADVSALAELKQLTALGLNENQITDVSALAKLTRLTVLGLWDNQITDVSALAELTQLTELWLSGNQLTDVSALARLKRLTGLWLSYNKLTEIPNVLEKLTQLTELHLGQSQLTDVSALTELTQLTTLHLGANQITDVSALTGLTQLTELDLSTNQITVLSALTGLTQLQKLWLGDNPKLAEAEIEKLRQALPECEISLEPRI